MNNSLFKQASLLYDSGDYRGALRKYTACLKDNSVPFQLGELGLIYHHIGNCLVKLKNPTEAIKAYVQAASDSSYQAKGALNNNIGMAYASLRDYENAVVHFEKAVADPTYESPYKAYMGMGNAQLKLGRSAEAGMSFREAALDEENPDPAKALLNLGVCFMSLDRPEDAIASYQSAFDFDMSQDTRNRLNSSMGQAYAAAGYAAEAVEAFNKATSDPNYILSDSAAVDYQRCVATLSRAGADAAAVDTSGLDVSVESHYFDDGGDPFFYDEGYSDEDMQMPGFIDAYDDEDEDRFFKATDDELEQWSRGLAKKDRKRRNVGLKILIAVIVVVVLLLGAAVFAFTQGFGFPTQQAVAEQLFNNPDEAKNSLFADSLSEANVNSIVAPVVQDPNVSIDGVNRSMSESTVYATATTDQGGKITYKIDMVRDFVGWKISGIELYFPSQNS
ncbi:tetratricopeptide repeat protein [Adlercreutzia sp. ZJ304]|uniref:tetratricopeptide repeat protein n=1 Tax=Adlercreutzia sp. ZJ304 TaxID=2709791 RepID=UPI0013EA85DA|nr:tetratricopeptide repeat protein [Adlercreutzia sp. ZJ304]